MPDPTPADELRAASALLRTSANAALMEVFTHPVPTEDADARYAYDMIGGYGGAAGDLAALFTPGAVTLLAEWLDAVADEMAAVDGTEYAYEEYPSWMAALATARAINATTGGQP